MNETTEVIRCAGGCGRSTTDPDLWDPCVETGKSYCDECWPNRTRRLEPIEFRVTETDDGDFEVHARYESSHGWSLMERCPNPTGIGKAISEEIVYKRTVASR